MTQDSKQRPKEDAIDWNVISPSALGIVSLACIAFSGNFTFAYVQAAPFVLLGAALGLAGILIAKRRLAAARAGSRWTWFVVEAGLSFLGLVANVALFVIALYDM